MRNKGTYIESRSPQDVFRTASNILFDAVEHTLGKGGKNTAIPTANNYLSIINDGKTILESLSSDDPAVRLALNTLKESSFATNQNAGDGTTTTTVLQHQLLTAILNYNATNSDTITSQDLLDMRDTLLKNLPNYKKEITNKEDLTKVINVALGGDDYLTEVTSNAFSIEDKIIVPAINKYKVPTTTSTVVDGITLSPVEINPVVLANMPTNLEEEFNVLIIQQTLSRFDQPLIELVKAIANSKKKTILLYTEIMPSVMDQLLFNIQEGSLHLIPIRLAYPLTTIDDYIAELERYFNTKAFTDLNQYQTFDSSEKLPFGTATGYIINKDSAVIKGNNPKYTSNLLPAKSSVINVGFITYSKQDEDFRRLEDAVHSASNALNSGYTIGSGYTLLGLSSYLADNPKSAPVREALSYLFVTLSSKQDLSSDQYIQYCMDNVFDSYKVTEQVILNAFTVVSQVLSTRCLLVPYE